MLYFLRKAAVGAALARAPGMCGPDPGPPGRRLFTVVIKIIVIIIINSNSNSRLQRQGKGKLLFYDEF